MSIWNPWRGCHKKSEGCLHCYIHGADKHKGINTDEIYKTGEFYKPIEKDAKGNYKLKSGQLVYLCFNSDFFIEEADGWRTEVWEIMKERRDLKFLFLTKRIERFWVGLPEDFEFWNDHIIICCTIENQEKADERLNVFNSLPIKHKLITIQPMLEQIDLTAYLNENIECVIVGGESGKDVRPLNYDWVLDIRRQCVDQNVSFEFRQLGSDFIKDGHHYHVKRQDLCKQAKKADIDFQSLKLNK